MKITNNCKKVIASILNDTGVTLRETEGGTVGSYQRAYWARYFPKQYIWLGSGSADETADDYKLASDITDRFITVSNVCTAGADEHMLYTVSQVFRNDQSTALTVSEIGLVFKNDSTNRYFLLAREVLDDPIVISPGDIRTFTGTLYL